MKYLITGLPACRSAWLAALLTAHGSPCAHEVHVTMRRPATLAELFAAGYDGLADPSATVAFRDTIAEVFAGCPTVLIRRDSAEARASFERWLGREVPGWGLVEAGVEWFEATMRPLVVPFAELNDAEVVDQLVRHVTGRPLDRLIFRLFDTLQIEQHKVKAAQVIRGTLI